MNVELIYNGDVIAGPFEYDATNVRTICAGFGIDPMYVPTILEQTMQIGPMRIEMVKEDIPTLGPLEVPSLDNRAVVDGQVVYTYTSRVLSKQEALDLYFKDLSDIHTKYKVTRFLFRGVYLLGDNESLSIALVVLNKFNATTVVDTLWRGKDIDGNVSKIAIADTAEMQDLYTAIENYAGAGYGVRSAIEDMLATLDVDALKTISVQDTWDAYMATLA